MTTTRPFRVLGVQQIAIGGPDKQRLRKLWVDVFGLEVTSTLNGLSLISRTPRSAGPP